MASVVEIDDTPKTPRDWIALWSAAETIEFYKTARTQTRNSLYIQHRSLTDDYCNRAMLYWLTRKALLPQFRANLVARRARFYYLDDLRAGRLQVENSEVFVDASETADPTRAQGQPLPDALLNNRELIELVKKLWPVRYLAYRDKLEHEDVYRGDGQIDNDKLADILHVDVADVRRALDCIRRKFKRHGLSIDSTI